VRRVLNPTRDANCGADGVAAGYTPVLAIEQSVAGLTGGNPDLQPEVGTTLTYGFVWQPSFVSDLSISVDRFDLHLDGIITSVARQTAVNLCYDTVDRRFCDVVTRGTNPLAPGANYVLTAVNEQQQNVATYDVTGFDIQTHYTFGLGSLFRTSSEIGDIRLSLVATIYDQAEQVPLPGEDVLQLLNSAGGSTIDQGYIRRQGVFDIGYALRNFNANWHMRYVGKAEMSPDSAEAGFPSIGSHTYHDVRAGYRFGEGSEVFVGVTNVFDKEPPFFASGTAGTQALDTIPGYYDIFGRSYFTGMRVKF
jgi:iron complex outermembrane receptor protein